MQHVPDGVKGHDITETLKERGSRYGSFVDQGRIEQNIKKAFADSPNWSTLPSDSKSALEMMATKISRILKGDPEFHDSWHDIVGYAKLVADRIENAETDTTVGQKIQGVPAPGCYNWGGSFSSVHETLVGDSEEPLV